MPQHHRPLPALYEGDCGIDVPGPKPLAAIRHVNGEDCFVPGWIEGQLFIRDCLKARQRKNFFDQRSSSHYVFVMIIVSPSTIWNSSALETRSVPKRVLGRITILPRTGFGAGTLLRLIFEVQVLRYVLSLVPFVIAMFVWPHLALPIAQAPILMVMVIALCETRLLAVGRDDREKLITDGDMARTLDALRFNATRLLTRLAARRGLTSGDLLLVIEQSELARIAPLTLVSIQQREPAPMVLTLDADEQRMIRAGLFDDQLTERLLHLVGLRENENLRTISVNTATISAHTRMTALLDRQPQDVESLQKEPT